MCTILDNAINKGIEQGIERGITQGENLKLIMGKNSGGFKSSNFDFFLIVIKIFSGFDWLKVF